MAARNVSTCLSIQGPLFLATRALGQTFVVERANQGLEFSCNQQCILCNRCHQLVAQLALDLW